MRGWVIRIAIIAVIAIGAVIFRDRLSSNASELKVGDCFDIPANVQTIEDVQHHPCGEPHGAEVFAVLTHPAPKGAPVLTDAEFADYLSNTCGPLWETYVGSEAAQSDVLTFNGFLPVDEGWTAGERLVTCVTYRADKKPMTASLKK